MKIRSVCGYQKQYLLDLIVKHGLTEANTVSTPADLNVKLEKDDSVSKRVDPTTYQSIIGGLMYAATATRPDELIMLTNQYYVIVLELSSFSQVL